MYYGTGFIHSDVYTMPTYLRNFYSQQLVKVKKEEKSQMDQANKQKGISRANIPGKNIPK